MSHPNKWLVRLLGLLVVSALVLAACGGVPDNGKAVNPAQAVDIGKVVNPAQAACTPGNQVDKPAFFTEVIQKLENPSVPVSDFAVKAFLAWEPHENTPACWNPLATKWNMQVAGQTDFLPNGVKSYPDRTIGIRATANTVNQTWDFYHPIRTMLAKQGFDEAALKQALIHWVGDSDYADALVAQWKVIYNQ